MRVIVPIREYRRIENSEGLSEVDVKITLMLKRSKRVTVLQML